MTIDAESTDVPGDVWSEADGWSAADSDASVPVRRSLRDVAASDEHKCTHKPDLPIHFHDCMVTKARRKRLATRRKPMQVKRFGDSFA